MNGNDDGATIREIHDVDDGLRIATTTTIWEFYFKSTTQECEREQSTLEKSTRHTTDLATTRELFFCFIYFLYMDSIWELGSKAYF